MNELGDLKAEIGAMAAAVVIDAVCRLLPGVLGAEDATEVESFAGGLLEYPHYTRPPEYRGLKVPEVLMSGDHAAIARWRREQAEARTRKRRPDLLGGSGGQPG